MKQIVIADIFEMIEEHNLVPRKECWLIHRESGRYERRSSGELLRQISAIRNPVVKTDDDGIIKIVTVDVFYDYRDNDLQTGKMIRFLLHRQKRIQPVLFSNGVGAPTHNTDCIPTLY